MSNNNLHNEDRKIRNWTALLPVRVACFILIIALAFVTLNRFVAIDNRVSDTGLGVDIVWRNVSHEQHFFDRNMHNARHSATTALRFESEESIRAGNHLIWLVSYFDDLGNELPSELPTDTAADFHDDFFDELDLEVIVGEWYVDENGNILRRITERRHDIEAQLITPDGRRFYVSYIGDNSPLNRAVAERNAINDQLEEFRWAMRYLEESVGLKYHISDMRGNVIANVAADLDWFRSQPVYLIMEEGSFVASSHYSSHDFDPFYEGHWISSVLNPDEIVMDTGLSIPHFRVEAAADWGQLLRWSSGIMTEHNAATVYLAFTSEALGTSTTAFADAREGFIRDFAIASSAVVLALALFALLMVGAGRKFAVSKTEGVHFAGIDKPFLDISFAFVFFWCFLWLFVSVMTINQFMWSPIVINTFMAVLAIAVVTPVLIWFMSLAKRVKAGGFWRHSLIYRAPRKLVDLLIPIWQGFKLMPKVALISVAAFFVLLFVGIVGDASRSGGTVFILTLIITAVIAFLLTRYALRLYALEQAARKTGEGDYDEDIDVGGGELGSIANSINNISAVINDEVEQRMKSERLKTELITNVSHDIRTPLTSIITYTDLLKKEGLDSEKAPEYLDILTQKSQRLKTLTDELFEAAKASTGNIDVNIAELDLVSLINQVLGELDSTIKSSGLDLRVNLPESMHVKADGKLMWRVLENLLSNVFKYSLPNSRVYIDVLEEDVLVRLDMKNISGAELNIDPAELMDRFKRGDDSRADGGNGLGLSIVQSFVVAQGGKFEIAIDGDLFKASVFLPPA